MYSIGPYGKQMVLDIDKYLKDMKVEGKDVLVIGTQIPWIELIAVVNKAKTVTTVEYQKIHCEHPKLEIMLHFINPTLPRGVPDLCAQLRKNISH